MSQYINHPKTGMDFAQNGLNILLRQGYEHDLKAGKLERQLDGSTIFRFRVPAPFNKTCRGIRRPDGEFYVHMGDFHQLLGGDEVIPYEHFEHGAHEIAAGRKPPGFGNGGAE